MKHQLITIYVFLFVGILVAQNTTVNKNTVLKDTDHGYFGIEGGLIFDFSPTYFQNPKYSHYAYNGLDVGRLISPAFRIFAGYKWKSNYFELGFSNISSMAKARYSSNSYDIFSRDFIVLQLCYYYKIPINSSFWSLCMGPEIGWAFADISDHKDGFDDYAIYGSQPNFGYDVTQPRSNKLGNLLLGFSVRNEFKVLKNLTLFGRLNFTNMIYNKASMAAYVSSDGPPDPPNVKTPFINPVWNFNLSFGLQFDFYSNKKKQQTFDQLGIEDPYKK